MSFLAEVPGGGLFVEKATMKVPMSRMHFHTGHEIYYLLSGERTYFMHDKEYRVSEGDLVTVPRGTLHRTGGKGGTRLLILFEETFLSRFFRPTTVEELLSGFDTAVLSPLPGRQETVAIRVNNLFRLGQEWMRQLDDATGARAALALCDLLYTLRLPDICRRREDGNERLGVILHYMEENYATLETIDQIAAAAYVSKFHLCHIFKETLGVSVIRYLNMIKIREACRRMERGEGDILDIALRCGFNSGSYFAKVFRRETGVSAGEYRKTCRRSLSGTVPQDNTKKRDP